MTADVDTFIGKRLRRRRRLLGLTQNELASKIGVRFQQIQKYECGANRINAGRLFCLSNALSVNVSYFFDGLAADSAQAPANDPIHGMTDAFAQKETMDLVRAYYRLGEKPRRHLLDLAMALDSDGPRATG